MNDIFEYRPYPGAFCGFGRGASPPSNLLIPRAHRCRPLRENDLQGASANVVHVTRNQGLWAIFGQVMEGQGREFRRRPPGSMNPATGSTVWRVPVMVSKRGCWSCRLGVSRPRGGLRRKSTGGQVDIAALTEDDETVLCEEVRGESASMVEWQHVCALVARFAVTAAGKRAISAQKNAASVRKPLASAAVAAAVETYSSGGHFAWVRAPWPACREESERLLDLTAACVDVEGRFQTPLVLSGIATDEIAQALALAGKPGACCSLEMLLSIMRLVEVSSALKSRLGTALRLAVKAQKAGEEGSSVPALQPIADTLDDPPGLMRVLRAVLVRDENSSLGYILCDDASPELRRCRSELRSALKRVASVMERDVSRLPKEALAAPYEPIERGGRMVLPLRSTWPGLRSAGLVVGVQEGVTIIEPSDAVAANNAVAEARRATRIAEVDVLREVTAEVGDYADSIAGTLDACIALDVSLARARFCSRMGAKRPIFCTPGDGIHLENLRHPVLMFESYEQYIRDTGSELGWEKNIDVVANDVILSACVRCVVVTGPNAGGKTVLLKAIAIAAMSARVGLFVCCSPVDADATQSLPWFSEVYADIGDGQSLDKSLSTYSGRIRRARRILRACELKKRAMAGSPEVTLPLCILDEVGAGTDPTEGTAIGSALLMNLAVGVTGGDPLASLTFASTHMGALAGLKYLHGTTSLLTSNNSSSFENASMEFDPDSFEPTYRLVLGIPGRSQAFTAARTFGIPEEVVASAERSVGKGAAEVRDVAMMLERERLQARRMREDAKKCSDDLQQILYESRKVAQCRSRGRAFALSMAQTAVNEALRAARADIAQSTKRVQRAGRAVDGRSLSSMIALHKADMETVAEDFFIKCSDTLADSEATKLLERRGDSGGGAVDMESDWAAGDLVHVPSMGDDTVGVVKRVSRSNSRGSGGLLNLKVQLGSISVVIAEDKVIRVGSNKASQDEPKGERSARRGRNRKRGGSLGSKQKTGDSDTVGGVETVMIQLKGNTINLLGKRSDEAEIALHAFLAKTDSPSLYVIHGVGTGALLRMTERILRESSRVVSFRRAPQAEGGNGCTIARLRP